MDIVTLEICPEYGENEQVDYDLNKFEHYGEMLKTVANEWNEKHPDNLTSTSNISIICPDEFTYLDLIFDDEDMFYFLKYIDKVGDINDESANKIFLNYLSAQFVAVPNNLEDFEWYYKDAQNLYYGCYFDEEDLVRDYMYNVLDMTWESIDAIIEYLDTESFINNIFITDGNGNYYYIE